MTLDKGERGPVSLTDVKGKKEHQSTPVYRPEMGHPFLVYSIRGEGLDREYLEGTHWRKYKIRKIQ